MHSLWKHLFGVYFQLTLVPWRGQFSSLNSNVMALWRTKHDYGNVGCPFPLWGGRRVEIFGDVSGVSKRILKGHLCTKGNHSVAAEVQLVLPPEHLLQLCRQQRHRNNPPKKAQSRGCSTISCVSRGEQFAFRSQKAKCKSCYVKECSQCKHKGFPGTDTAGITALPVVQVALL